MSDAKDLSPLPEQLSQGSPDDITEEPPTETTTVKPHKSGRFKRTALTFFGVRKSICILPSFFGGRSKNQSKWPSKKGLTKSRTHDGLSHDDNLRGVYSSSGDFEYRSHRDSAGELHASCHSECSHTDQKSLTLTRQKKGLRGLFSSFKYHRNHRNVGLDKAEMIAMTSPISTKEVPVVQDNTKQFVTECLGSEPDVPNFADDKCDIPLGLECIDTGVMSVEKHVEQESPKSKLDDQLVDDQMEEMNFTVVVPDESEEIPRDHSEPCLTMSEPILKLPTPTGSSEQLNLMFGEVASLKSFDSLTGCGDIIADQEDDSITESTVSGERSRSGGKRASCFLTYQGGGEDMASPEDLDEECLQDFWRNNASEEICSTCNQDHTDLTADLTSSHNIDLLTSKSEQQASGMDTSIADVLTPQSEHQESVPNSDEGYYDSTTPGPEEGQEKAERLRADRMPRDSYSGDALYELFAPDESLLSPHYESKSKLPASNQCEYLGDAGDDVDSAFVPDINRLHISAEVYKVHSFHERLSPCNKSSELAQNMVSWPEMGANKNCKSNPKPQTSANKSNTNPDVLDDKEDVVVSVEKRKKTMSAESEKRHSTISFGSTSDPDFETFCEPKEQHLEENKPVALPYRNISAQSPVCASELDDGQTVSFSQALVDYTKHSQMLSNLPNNTDDLERNPAFTPHMQALPTIVTFDVVDMHNEGEYDEQIHMELEEDISSPYQEFEESYLQKDAFAEFDYQMLDLYDQNLISNTWAVASLPRHLGLTRVSQSMSHPLSLDRRSRSLDTESLELKMPDAYRAAIVSCSQAEKIFEKGFSPFYKKNVPVSASEVRDSRSIMALSWQTRSEMALSLPAADGEMHAPSQTQAKQKLLSGPPGGGFPNGKQHLSSNMPDRIPCDFMPQNSELRARQCHSCLQSDCAPSHSPGVYSGMMEEASGDADKFAITQLL